MVGAGGVHMRKRPGRMCALVACLAVAGCASVRSGKYARPLDSAGRMAEKPVTASGLLISGQEVSDLASPYYGLLELTFENTTDHWLGIDRTSVSFDSWAADQVVIPTGPEITSWEQAIRQRNA